MQEAMDTIEHRGPDDWGIECIASEGHQCWVGNSRLAILDLSPAGHMPMADPSRRNWITFNGEIYNFQSIRRELEALGESFTSQSDTEVILKAYGQWHASVVDHLRGQFAFAIWDEGRQELFLARDRLGLKPLYYALIKQGFLFGSEVRTLLSMGSIERRLDPVALESYMWNGFVISPRTLIKGCKMLMPGHWMRVNREGRIVETVRYWSLPGLDNQEGKKLSSQEHLRDLLEDATSLRLISDVPVGAFLSGGLDSSTIVALMAKNGGDVRTYSVALEDEQLDESHYSKAVADQFHTQHNEISVGANEFSAWMPDALAALDQPTFDGLNTYIVSRAVRETGLKVALSGLGADELFGGYPYFRSVPWLSMMRSMAERTILLNTAVAAVGRQLPSRRVSGFVKTLELFSQSNVSGLSVFAGYQVSQLLFPEWTRNELLQLHRSPDRDLTFMGIPNEFLDFVKAELDGGDTQDVISRCALRLFLGERLLRDTDVMSMAVSLEVRAPFTDHLFVEGALRLPGRERTKGAPNKSFQRDLASPWLDSGYVHRNKQGFILPFEAWLRDSQSAGIIRGTLMDGRLAEQLGFRQESVAGFLGDFAEGHERSRVPWSRIWALFVLFDWAHRNGVSA